MGLQIIKPDTKIDFMAKRNIAFFFSGALILMGIISLLVKGGPNYGIDFAGGINVQVKFAQDVDLAQLKATLSKADLPSVRVQRFGQQGMHEYLLRFPAKSADPEKIRKEVERVLSGSFKGVSIQRLEMVGPKVGADLKNKALEALFYAVLLISIYISGRFEQKWITAAIMAGGLSIGIYVLELLSLPMSYLIVGALLITLGLCWFLRLNYALGAVVALIHDVMITVGIFSILNKDFDLTTIAALLTIIGYSLNDTIVIFDRIRENLRGKIKRRSLFQIINQSINETLSRTILTSGTTLIVVISLLVLGGGVIHDFAVALTIGIVVGTYSSIYIAGAILLGFGPTPEAEQKTVAQ